MTIEPITIRSASREDAELIATFSRKTFYDTFAPQNSRDNMEIFLSEQFTKASLMDEVGISTNLFYLAYAGSKLAGYVKLREGENPRELHETKNIEIARLYADQSMIGKGVGSTLMQHCIDIARQKQKEVIWLAVWEKNAKAMEFYKRWGFEVFGKQVFVLGTDLQKDWLMKREL